MRYSKAKNQNKFCKMAENCKILHLKLNIVRQLKILLNSMIYDGMNCLSEKGYLVECAIRSVDQQHSLTRVLAVTLQVASHLKLKSRIYNTEKRN